MTLAALVLLPRVVVRFAKVEIDLRRNSLECAASKAGVSLGQPTFESGVRPVFSTGEIRRIRVVQAVARRWPWGGESCLREALVQASFLRGHDTVIRFGARPTTDPFLAHAWLEVGSRTIGRRGTHVALTPADSRQRGAP